VKLTHSVTHLHDKFKLTGTGGISHLSTNTRRTVATETKTNREVKQRTHVCNTLWGQYSTVLYRATSTTRLARSEYKTRYEKNKTQCNNQTNRAMTRCQISLSGSDYFMQIGNVKMIRMEITSQIDISISFFVVIMGFTTTRTKKCFKKYSTLP
jgi:hypothetical protein